MSVLDRNLPKFPQDVFIQVSKELENGDLKWRPKPKELIDLCTIVNTRLHPVRENKPEQPKSNDDIQRRMGSKLVELILSGKATWQQIFDNIRLADKERPHGGWDKCGMELERHHKFHGTNLDEVPQNIISTSI